jgi:hypothetical protein
MTTSIHAFQFTGVNASAGPVPISVPGLRVGDVVIWGIWNNSGEAFVDGSLESIISVNGQVQQLIQADYSTYPCKIIIVRGLIF